MPFNLVYHSPQDAQWKNDFFGFSDPGDSTDMPEKWTNVKAMNGKRGIVKGGI